MMGNINKVTQHLKKKVVAAGGDPMREAMTILSVENGDFFHIDEAGDFWTLCLL